MTLYACNSNDVWIRYKRNFETVAKILKPWPKNHSSLHSYLSYIIFAILITIRMWKKKQFFRFVRRRTVCVTVNHGVSVGSAKTVSHLQPSNSKSWRLSNEYLSRTTKKKLKLNVCGGANHWPVKSSNILNRSKWLVATAAEGE
jgi:N12 class adenine-specific DNA methylase